MGYIRGLGFLAVFESNVPNHNLANRVNELLKALKSTICNASYVTCIYIGVKLIERHLTGGGMFNL